MSELTVSGTLTQVSDSLHRISEVVKNRQALGFDLLCHDEDWIFVGQRDERQCPVCRSYEHTVHRGDYIPQRFPFYQFVDYKHIKPNIHLQFPWLKGPCRCLLEFVNVHEVLENRLHKEKVTVLG